MTYPKAIFCTCGITGLAGTLGVTLLDAADGATVRAARTTAGVAEVGASGVYRAVATFDDAWTSGTVAVWDDGTAAFRAVETFATPVSFGGGGTGQGNGDVAVDHNYGGVDRYRIRKVVGDQIAYIDDALVQAWTAYPSGELRAQTRTGTDGRWVAPLMLDAGEYRLIVSKSGVFETINLPLVVEVEDAD